MAPKFEYLWAAVMDIAPDRASEERVFMRWIITVVVVAGKEQNSRSTVRPTDQTTPGQADGDDIACPQDEERRRYDGLRSGGNGAGRKGC